MHLEHDGNGRIIFAIPKQRWSGDDIMQTAVFAGQHMMAIFTDENGFELHYLGLKTGGFATMAAAQEAAPAFARAVLAELTGLIED